MAEPVIAIIPTRLESVRFPRKALAGETGLPLTVHVAQNARAMPAVSRVIIATDSDEIEDAVRSHGFEVVRTRKDHPNGTSRIAEAVDTLALPDEAIVVNVQGDEPELESGIVEASVEALRSSGCPVSTASAPLGDDEASNPNIVKVCTDVRGRALYFSRSVIPASRDGLAMTRRRHIGLYVYRASFLREFVKLEPTPLEIAEHLEQLRVLEHGHPIAVSFWEGEAPAGIDTPEQYEAFVQRYKAR